MPSISPKCRSNKSMPAKIVTPRRSGSSFFKTPDFTGRGAIKAVMPRTIAMLAILEPSALPMARSPAPDVDAINDTSISGAEVPNDTMVKPISMGDIPKFLAVAAAPKTNLSALQTKSMSPAISAKIGYNIDGICSNKRIKRAIKTECYVRLNQ